MNGGRERENSVNLIDQFTRMASPRQLAAIMFTDIVGYTALMQRNEDQAVATTRRYLAVLREAAANYGGKILNDYGDGSLCIFSSAVDALKGAADMQRKLQQPPVVPLRVGLHIGEIFFEEGKVFGDGVNIASRVQSLGIGGAVLFSKDLYETVRGNPDFKAVLLGTFAFKNVEEPMEVFALTGKGLTVPRREQMHGKLKVPVTDTGQRRTIQKSWLAATATVYAALGSGWNGFCSRM